MQLHLLKRRSDFLTRAAGAEAMARAAASPALRESWMECAASWRFMAEKATEQLRITVMEVERRCA